MFGSYPWPIIYSQMDHSKNIYPLYDPSAFHDACGTGFIVTLSGKPEKRVLPLALKGLQRLDHRGAVSADKETGDGAGVLTDIPHPFFREIIKAELGIRMPFRKKFAVGMVFTTSREIKWLKEIIKSTATLNGFNVVAVREVKANPNALGKFARNTKPLIVQFFLVETQKGKRPLETRLYLLRKTVEKEILAQKKKSYICSFSSETIVYKGLMTSTQLDHFYPDLTHPKYVVKLAIFHERFSTNTKSTWAMAQPFRMLAHNGEINTIKANRLWMTAREREIKSRFWNDDLENLKPIVNHHGSDSESLDHILEFLTQSGRDLFSSTMMLIPDPYEYDKSMPRALKDFYIYHENFIEPWDGPAAVVFTDGSHVVAKMDRNGLRPLRYSITKDGLVIMASEAGIIDIADNNLVVHHHMRSGEIFAVSLKGKGIIRNKEIKKTAAAKKDYSSSLNKYLTTLKRKSHHKEFGIFGFPEQGFDPRLRVAFGWSKEDLTRYLISMATSGREPIGSMGDDTPPAVMSLQDRRFYDHFKQSFAQVTNPPIDSIRERGVMALFKYLGSENNLLDENPTFGGVIRIESPVLSPREVLELHDRRSQAPYKRIYCHCALDQDLNSRLSRIKSQSREAVKNGAKIIFLTNENLKQGYLPIPMPLVVSAVHHALVKNKLRSAVSLICLSGDVVEDHHVAVLIGLGASAVYPFMAYELIREHFHDDKDWPNKMANYRYALEKGILKIMSKMGISTISSYHGGMLFHTLGLDKDLIGKYFPSFRSELGGIGLNHIKQNLMQQHSAAFLESSPSFSEKGYFRFRKNGESHGYSPPEFKTIQAVAHQKEQKNIRAEVPVYLRDLFQVKGKLEPIDVKQTESLKKVLKRFGSGAISFGAISETVHRELARGMALVGARSNTGEGGELDDRYSRTNPDKDVNSYIKQVASGRFGVSVDYLAASREIQIKMAQGAKPGEGGQLPGHKVTAQIAHARSSTLGVPLISPPPHHDIYSIEDLKQLIHDLKEVNPRALISVKLVAQPGVGTVACGVVKAGADIILISGADGGTGASPLGSLKHTGLPWELGLAETHQTLVANQLRDRVTLRVDGGLKKARDIIIAATLGAEEYDFGTAALIALGCIMARQCHLNTCPVGIATQDVKYMKKFKGNAGNIKLYFEKIAEDVKDELAKLGFKTIQSLVGRSDLLSIHKDFKSYVKKRGLDFSGIFNPDSKKGLPIPSTNKVRFQGRLQDQSLDEEIITEVRNTIMTHGHAVVSKLVNNTQRSIGTRLSGEIAFLYGKGNFQGNIQVEMSGTAGQSLGAYLSEGVELRLMGTANDYVGKGQSGGLITIRMPRLIRRKKKEHTMIGNVALYGATGGTLFVAGRGGERFAVRNSGASAVIEGIGNHGCEYMTRGTVVVLGEIGHNFGAGMTGGSAFIYTKKLSISSRLNTEFVKESNLTSSDENLLKRLLNTHVFHTGSVIASQIISGWKKEKYHFKCIVSLAQDIVDFKNIYDLHVADRLGVVLNE